MSSLTTHSLLAGCLLAGGVRSLTAEEATWRPLTTERDRYVTRFQPHRELTYAPTTHTVSYPVVRRSWLPGVKPQRQSRSVTAIRWAPKWREEVRPITERMVVPTTRLVQTPGDGRGSFVTHATTQAAPSIAASAPVWGGVAALGDQPPRVGLALQATRR